MDIEQAKRILSICIRRENNSNHGVELEVYWMMGPRVVGTLSHGKRGWMAFVNNKDEHHVFYDAEAASLVDIGKEAE